LRITTDHSRQLQRGTGECRICLLRSAGLHLQPTVANPEMCVERIDSCVHLQGFAFKPVTQPARSLRLLNPAVQHELDRARCQFLHK
jgi:hypothetical protein